MAGTHARKSPSGAERLHACPGALAFEDTLPAEQRSTSGPAARMGTAAHFLLEKALREQQPPETYRDRIIELLGRDEDGSMLRPGAKLPGPSTGRVVFLVDDDLIEGTTLAYEYVMARCEDLWLEPKDLQLETKTNPCPERDDTPGTADITIDIPRVLLELVDYKNGRLTVEVYVLDEQGNKVGNPQLLSYLAGKAQETGWSHATYRITIVQPWVKHEDGRIRSVEFTRAELEAFITKHRAAAELADRAEDLLRELGGNVLASNTGSTTWADDWLAAGDHCTFCDAAVGCPVRKRFVQERAGIDFDDPPTGPAPGISFPDEARKVLAAAPYFLAQLAAARKFAMQEVLAGRGAGVGQKAVRKTSYMRWRPDLPQATLLAQQLVKDGLIGDNQVEQVVLTTMQTGPKVKMLISGRKDKATGLSPRDVFVEKYLHKPENPGVKMVPIDDPAEAVVVSAADDFPEDDFDA